MADGSVSGGAISEAMGPAEPPPEVRGETASEFSQAVEFIREGAYVEAEILLLGITSDQPELAGPWINLGQVYVAMNQPEEARRAFEAAALANPWNCTAHNELGLLSRLHGDFEAAEQHYLRCLERVPANGPANLNLGILYELYLGRLPEALSYYRQYQALLAEPDRRVQGWVMDLERRLGV
jgi:tetratricopeptide (TPR) repeat protein